MSRESGVIEKIGNELGIARGNQEEDSQWKSRIIYSAAGRIALASLWDVSEDEQAISIIHFKRRAERELKALISSSSVLGRIYDGITEAIIDEIYSIYLNAGYIYHTPNHIEPVPEKVVSVGKNCLIRGSALQESVHMSGLGLYSQSTLKDKYNTVNSVNELFKLPQIMLTDYINKLLKYAEWKVFGVEERAEYLRMSPPFSGGYWCKEADKTGGISLLRIGQPGRHIYYLYKFENKSILSSPLATWMTDGYEYRQIACGLLMQNNKLPMTRYMQDGRLVHIHIGYLYPPAIQNFVKLYSWPETMNHFPSDFRRVMTGDLFEVFRMIIEPLGFGFMKG